ncbi:iron-containing redox enzyme family protein [Mycobacterium sp. AMU20-3851]|uniref:iron-containing redox enzyme family protein n=1 Tax=Mycobacterium sp. AMU20-3851 TaxID=3122055 RepID=UPI003754AFFB
MPGKSLSPALPAAAGPVSAAVTAHLAGRVQDLTRVRPGAADPLGLDIQLTLYVCYELTYRGFAGVDPSFEWDADLIGLRGRLERVFLDQLHERVPTVPVASAADEMHRVAAESDNGGGPARFLLTGTWQQMREYFVHRSVHRLKEADPQAWVIPRLTGQAKASFVAIEFDEYGSGHASHMDQRLFAELMAAAELDDAYLAYLTAVPAESLAVVNLMSMFGLHRSLRGAAVGHFAATEITSPPYSQRIADALVRLDAPPVCTQFYREHAEACSENGVAIEVVRDLLAAEPELNDDIVFGIRAHDLVERLLAEHMVKSWSAEETSLLRALP